jgi:plastocyanin
MRPREDRTPPETSGTKTPRLKLTTLKSITALALCAIGLIYLFEFLSFWLTGGVIVLPVLILACVTLLLAGFVMTKVVWAPALGALVVLITSTVTLAQPLAPSALLHPALDLERFVVVILVLACALIVLGAGIAAAMRNYQGRSQQTPRWMGYALTGLCGLVVGMIVVASIVTANPQNSSASAAANGMPTVHIAGSDFLTNVVLVPKGEKLLLVDDDAVEHIIQNGFWTPSGTPQPRTEAGAPVVHSLDLKGGSKVVGPFTTAGTFHLYCTIHQGMNLTIVVQ